MSKVKFNIGGVIIEMEQEEVSKAIEAGEVKIESENLVSYSKTDFETFITNKSDIEYKKGRNDGAEMLSKTLKQKRGLEFEGKVVRNKTDNVDFEQTAELFWNGANPLIESSLKIEPTKKIQELETEKRTLQENYKTLESEFTGFKTQITEKEIRSNKDNHLRSFIPITGLKVNQDITLMALKSQAGVDIAFDENNTVFVTENGQPVKDNKLLTYVDPKQYIQDKLNDLDLIEKPSGGKGEGDNNKGGSASNYDKFVKEMESNGVSEGSQQFGEEMNKRIKSGILKM